MMDTGWKLGLAAAATEDNIDEVCEMGMECTDSTRAMCILGSGRMVKATVAEPRLVRMVVATGASSSGA